MRLYGQGGAAAQVVLGTVGLTVLTQVLANFFAGWYVSLCSMQTFVTPHTPHPGTAPPVHPLHSCHYVRIGMLQEHALHDLQRC